MLGAIKALLSLVSGLTRWAQQRQLIEAGAAQSVLQGVRDADAAIEGARAARAAVKHDADSVRDDPANRDR